MGILAFLKKLFQSTSPQEPQAEGVKVKISQLKEWITESNKNNGILEEEIKEQLSIKLNELCTQLEQKNQVLKTIDISSYKVEEKIKLIVKENLPYYAIHLDLLMNNIHEILSKKKSISLEDFINTIALTFNDFEKRSFKNYQKATILIGKEIGDSKEVITFFTSFLQKTVREHEIFFSKKKSLERIKKSLQEYQEVQGNEEYMKESIIKLNAKIDALKKEKEAKEKEASGYQKSIPYLQFLKSQEEIKREIQENEKDLANIKQSLNIKFLLKAFHNDKKKSKLIKSYEDVISALKDDAQLKIIEVINEALSLKNAPKELSIITKERLEKLQDRRNTLMIKEDSRIVSYADAIKRKEEEILSLSKEQEKELVKQEKLTSKLSQSLDNLKQHAIAFNLELQA